MRYSFLSLASQLLPLIDSGQKLDINETHKHIKGNTLFTWLQEHFEGRIDIGQYPQQDLNAIEKFFNTLSQVVDERRKMGIEKNGLCLLLAYCLEAIDENPETIQSGS